MAAELIVLALLVLFPALVTSRGSPVHRMTARPLDSACERYLFPSQPLVCCAGRPPLARRTYRRGHRTHRHQCGDVLLAVRRVRSAGSARAVGRSAERSRGKVPISGCGSSSRTVFLHGSLLHLAFNMFALYIIGSAISERVCGARRHWMDYLVCVVSAAITQLVFASVAGLAYPLLLGASWGVFPCGPTPCTSLNNRIMLLFPPIAARAILSLRFKRLLELFLGVSGAEGGVAHFAHLGGLVGGSVSLRFRRGASSRGRSVR